MRKIILTGVCFLYGISLAFAQGENMNNTEHDYKPFYFGITIGLNTSQYKIFHSKYFTDYDSVKEITPLWRPGFQLGIMANARLTGFVDARTVPSFVLREKAIRYKFQDEEEFTNAFESILFSWPFEFKFKGDRQENFRFYAIAGGKVDYDFNAGIRSRRSDEILKVKPWDVGYNLGFGFEFYFPNFILAPEVKLSQGLLNSLDKNNDGEEELPVSKSIEKINTRMIIFSLHIQG